MHGEGKEIVQRYSYCLRLSILRANKVVVSHLAGSSCRSTSLVDLSLRKHEITSYLS